MRNMGVRTNADTPEDAVRAREFGAEGIGLCRTEHMFFADDRLPVVQQMILAKDAAAREPLLAKLAAMQQQDFYGILKTVMAALCHDSALNYVSCSPFRVRIARLAAAHAAIHDPR